MDVSRSGRIRKKNSQLADFESPDEIDLAPENHTKAPMVTIIDFSELEIKTEPVKVEDECEETVVDVETVEELHQSVEPALNDFTSSYLTDDVDLDLVDLGLTWLTLERDHKPDQCEECKHCLFTSLGMHDYALPPLDPEPIAESMKMHDYASEEVFIDPLEVQVKIEEINTEVIQCQKCGQRHDSAFICNVSEDHKCRKCGKGFKSQSCLKRHESTHVKEKNYFCPQCGKGFARRDVLARHIRMHNGIKPYECELCGKRFTDSGNLACHQQNIHFKMRNHLCLTCGKRFKSKWYLTKHQEHRCSES